MLGRCPDSLEFRLSNVGNNLAGFFGDGGEILAEFMVWSTLLCEIDPELVVCGRAYRFVETSPLRSKPLGL